MTAAKGRGRPSHGAAKPQPKVKSSPQRRGEELATERNTENTEKIRVLRAMFRGCAERKPSHFGKDLTDRSIECIFLEAVNEGDVPDLSHWILRTFCLSTDPARFLSDPERWRRGRTAVHSDQSAKNHRSLCFSAPLSAFSL